ncbi:unnamed protein product [Rotaria sp. Silwood2]|nr:unnamed protein product [Rotaria sp. Silwood2]CAF3452418.1 unnamed protein product [Rotaria sp. Silwood2]CAF4725369.1 unnamed protein product [Rotaria sp. Silwood2]
MIFSRGALYFGLLMFMLLAMMKLTDAATIASANKAIGGDTDCCAASESPCCTCPAGSYCKSYDRESTGNSIGAIAAGASSSAK